MLHHRDSVLHTMQASVLLYNDYAISALRNATLKKDDEINNLKDRISWIDKMLGMFTKILMQSNGPSERQSIQSSTLPKILIVVSSVERRQRPSRV